MMSSVLSSECQPHTAKSQHTSLLTKLRMILATVHQRRSLREMEDHLLRDIGISYAEAQKEAQKPLWDVPDTWRR
ncbi:DUF1127 domain-containing protein [Loktanella agnita]|uniref:DUF1127 domain-containing protein n=1 Tax=Loktanella agnita TaxID=287097 RepID=UPI003985805A